MIKRKKLQIKLHIPILFSVLEICANAAKLLNINCSRNKILIKNVDVTELRGFLNHTILYNVFSHSMTAARQKLLYFHGNYSLQSAENKMSLCDTNIVAIRTGWNDNAVL